MIGGAAAYSRTEIALLHVRGRSIGRLSVDVDAEPAVDHASAQFNRYLRSLIRTGSSPRSSQALVRLRLDFQFDTQRNYAAR